MKHMLLLSVIFTASAANALYLADCDQYVNCVCRADRKGQLKLDNGKLFVCTGSRWNLYEEYGDESHPGFWWFLGVADTNDVIQKIEKTLNNTHTTTKKLTNNSFRNTKKHPGFSCKVFKDRKGEESANGIYWMS